MIVEAWNKQKILYQLRYSEFYRKYQLDPENREVVGHLHEASYVLINIFGLTGKQVEEIEKNKGLTNRDIEEKF